MEELPQKYKTAGILMLVAGIMNVVQALSLTLVIGIYVLASAGMLFFCCFCCFMPLIGAVFGGFEIFIGAQILQGKVVPKAPQISIGGIVASVLAGAFVPMVLEIVATVMLQDDEVKTFLIENDAELLT